MKTQIGTLLRFWTRSLPTFSILGILQTQRENMEATMADVDGKRRPVARHRHANPASTSVGTQRNSQYCRVGSNFDCQIERETTGPEHCENIDKKAVEEHFRTFVENSEGYINENGRLDGCKSFLVASHVSQEEMREYYEHRSYEGTPSGHLRFLDHSDDGRLWIVELPGKVHELTASRFRRALDRQDVSDNVSFLGSLTATVRDRGMKADDTFGPRGSIYQTK
jgi:hypothetical protein